MLWCWLRDDVFWRGLNGMNWPMSELESIQSSSMDCPTIRPGDAALRYQFTILITGNIMRKGKRIL